MVAQCGYRYVVFEGAVAEKINRWLENLYAVCDYKKEMQDILERHNQEFHQASVTDIFYSIRRNKTLLFNEEIDNTKLIDMVGIEKGDAEEGDMVCYRYKGDYNIQSKFVDGVLYLTYQYANSSDLATDIDAMAKGVNGAIYWGEWPEHECLGRTNDEEGKYFGKELSNEHDTNGNSLPRIVPKFDFAKL